jgi:2-polyprenyl-3-methyl-5-hydroxy-6-metoxy-1,4-benzoquinol methylase
MIMADYHPQVREQYEAFPYPQRDPENEKSWLVTTWLDDLAMINHHCFAGRQTFGERFRVLVAGGGTGDATIFLAHQLRNTDAEIVHIDMSSASIGIARQRAAIRNLDNITWINESLLSIPQLGLGSFDYINCIGVLHHLEDPDAGLRALTAVLKDDGAMAIMVYGRYGRAGVYQMQSLLRLINQHETTVGAKLANARALLEALPKTNWFKRGEDLIVDHLEGGDAGIVDVLLHACDRAYSVSELYAWFEDQHGLQLTMTNNGRGRAVYEPAMVMGRKAPEFLQAVATLPLREQYEIAELAGGTLITHSFFTTRRAPAAAPYGNAAYVPFFHFDKTALQLLDMIERNQGRALVVDHALSGVSRRVEPGPYTAWIMHHIDGKRSFAEIFALLRAAPEFCAAAPGDEALFRSFAPVYEFLSSLDRILLRHRDVAPLAQ